MSVYLILLMIITTSLLDTINQLFLKTAINTLDINIKSIKNVVSLMLKIILIPRIWLGGLCSLFSLVLWLFVLSKADLNFAFSADSVHYIFVALGAKMFLKEEVGKKRWLGTLLIITGIILITASNS